MASGPDIDSKFRDSHITGKYPSFEDGAMKANTMMSPRHTARSGELANAADTCIHWICYYGSSKMRSIVIIIELSYLYRDNFDLSYRLSIENSIWHIVTALQIRSPTLLPSNRSSMSVVPQLSKWCFFFKYIRDDNWPIMHPQNLRGGGEMSTVVGKVS